MEEVRSYWQVANITHFCLVFGKQFKLPTFEPEELEQAFVLEIPNPITCTTNTTSNNHNNNASSSTTIKEDNEEDLDQEDDGSGVRDDDDDDIKNQDDYDDDYVPTNKNSYTNNNNFETTKQQSPPPSINNNQNAELHLLVKLAIPLLRPHFNSKISPENWQNYLRRLFDSIWVGLENYTNPMRSIEISPEGEEIHENLNFNELTLSDKIEVFNTLCDYRFWCEDAADAFKDYLPEELRLESIGKDSKGFEYWYFSGTRLYREKKDLVDDIITRTYRKSELNYQLSQLKKIRVLKEIEDKKKQELERIRHEEALAREERSAIKRGATKKKRELKPPPLTPLRPGLRERRTSTTSNTSDSRNNTPAKQTIASSTSRRSNNKSSSKLDNGTKHADIERPKKDPELEVMEELDKIEVTHDERIKGWRLECESLDEWEEFLTRFEKTKSTNERYLYAYLNDELVPLIRNIYNKRASEARRKEKELLFALSSRRTSSRIVCKKAQEEEEERQAQLTEQEMRRKKLEAEARLKAELEREFRMKKNQIFEEPEANGHDSSRYSLRTQSFTEFNGIIHPDKLAEFYEAIELDTVRTCKHAWPFTEPVPETVPNYYDLVSEPMDLKTLRNKIEFREYKSLIEVEKDFKLIINNCEKYNGPTNVYTKMSYKLWKVFRKNIMLFMQRDLNLSEEETFLFPAPAPKPPPPPQPVPEKKQANNVVRKFKVEPDLDANGLVHQNVPKKRRISNSYSPSRNQDTEELPVKKLRTYVKKDAIKKLLDQLLNKVSRQVDRDLEKERKKKMKLESKIIKSSTLLQSFSPRTVQYDKLNEFDYEDEDEPKAPTPEPLKTP